MDGKYYYVKNGRLLTSCVEQIDGSYYGFDGYGVLYVNQEFPLYDYETQTSIRYKAKEDGRLYVNEWYTITVVHIIMEKMENCAPVFLQ